MWKSTHFDVKRVPWIVCLGGGLFVVVRLVHLLTGGAVIDADEAVVGLMARRILQGEHVVYYWGQDYMGSLEAYTAALVFRFFPATPFTLKLTPFLYAAVLLALLVWLARKSFSRTASRYLLFLAAVPSPFVLIWTLKARGGYIETLVLGALLFVVLFRWVEAAERFPSRVPATRWRAILGGLCTAGLAVCALMLLAQVVLGGFSFRVLGVRIGNSTHTKPLVAAAALLPLHLWLAGRAAFRDRPWISVCTWALAFGFVAGLSWWTNALVVFFWVPALAAAGIFLRRLLVDAGGQLSALPAVLAGFLLGALPMWFHEQAAGAANAAADPLVEGEVWRLQFSRFFTVGLPRFLGVRWHPEHGITPFSSWVLAGFTLAVVLFGVFSLFTAILRREPAPRLAVRLMTVLLVVLFPWLFSLSEFGGFVQEPRYYLPLHAGLLLLSASLCGSLHAWTPPAGVLVCAVLLTIHGNNIRQINFKTAQPAVQGRRAPLDLSPVHAFFEENGIEAGYANYWLAYRMTFETGERVIVAPHPRGHNDRYPAYTAWVDAHPNPAYIFMDSIASGVANRLGRLGVEHYEIARFPPIVVVYNMEPVPDADDR
jgi:hypothetical protein